MTAPANLSNAAIAKYAEQVGQHYDIYDETGQADLETLREKLGGRLEYSDRPESSLVLEPGHFVVYLPQSTSMRRDRFTLAHELGHYFLHYLYPGLKGSKAFGRGARNRAETEANVFASALLMPEQQFRAAYSRYGGEDWLVAAAFDVSPAAADVRAQVLGLK